MKKIFTLIALQLVFLALVEQTTYACNTTIELGNPVIQCGGSVTLDATVAGATYLWSDNSTNATLVVTASGTYAVTVTDANSCTQTDAVVITINPVPDVNITAATSQSVCVNTNTAAVTFSGSLAGTVYNWTNNDPSIGLAASGTGDIAAFTGLNATNVPVTATITVTPTSSNNQLTPELLYYKFDGAGTSVPNLASAPPAGTTNATIMGGVTQGGSGICSGTLIGSGVASSTDYLNTGWAPNLTNTSWTISFKSSNITASATLFYIFGDANSSSFRCFTNGVAGANNWILRGGFNDVLLSGGATVAPHTNTFVYDITSGNIYAYLDGVLVNTVAQTTPTITGVGPFKVMGYGTNVGSPAGGLLDEFMVFSHALTATEVQTLAAGCNSVPCVGTPASFNITVNPNPVVNLGNDTAVCGGLTLDAGNAGSAFFWSNSSTDETFVVSGTGNYAVTVTDANTCSAFDDINVTVNPFPVVSLGSDVVQCSGSVTLDAGNAGSSYLWNGGSTGEILLVSSSGNYAVTVTTVNTCSATDDINIIISPPDVTPLANQSVCVNTNTTAVTFTGILPGTVYDWTNTDPSIGLAATGTGDIAAFTALNTTSLPVTATVTVTPSFTGNYIQPELLYYKFDGSGTSVPNLASTPPAGTTTATIMGGVTQGAASQCDGSLIGSGVASSTDYLNTGWAPNLTGSSWTISFKSSNFGSTNSLYYIFGDANSGSFRCFTNGVAGANNWILRGTFTDVYLNGGATAAPHTNTFVYDASAGNIYAYLDGALVSTVAQTGPTINGAGPFKVMGYGTNIGSPVGGLLDEFMVFSHALTATEVQTLASGCNVAACVGNPHSFDITVNPVPVVTLGSDVTACSSTTLDAGNAGSTYFWSNSSTDETLVVSANGNYAVTVTDANTCTGTDNINVVINTPPTVALGSDVTQCGGSVPLDAGNAGATYLWSDNSTAQTLSVSSSGTVSVVVTDANTCTGTDAIDVTINTPPTVALGSDITQCGGSASLDAGNAGASYLWSDGSNTQTVSVSATGTIGVTVTDANTCTGADAIDVTINTPPTVALGSDITQCGGTATLDAGNAGASYLWSDGTTTQTVSVTATGTIGVTVTDANTCTGTDNVDVTINTIPTASLTLPQDSACSGSSAITLSGGSPAGGTFTGTNVSGGNFTPSSAGTYTIAYEYADGNGCKDTAYADITVYVCVGINELTSGSVVLYPNPSHDFVTLKAEGINGKIQLEIFDMAGKKVEQTNAVSVSTGYTQTINLTKYAAGTYVVNITTENGSVKYNLIVQ